MIIYHYLRDFPGDEPVSGGLDKAVAGLAGGMSADLSVTCTVLCEGKRALNVIRPEGFRVRCFDNAQTREKRFGLAPGLINFVRNDLERGALVVLHAIFNPSVHLMSKLLRKRGIRYIISPHDPYHPAMFVHGKLKKAIYWRFFEKPMLDRAAAVQVLDRRHEQFLRDRAVRTTVIEVVNGFLPDEVPSEQSLTWRGQGTIQILFLGRLDVQNKGLDLLIEAFSGIGSPGVQLTLQGPDRGEGARVKQLIASRNLQERVTVLPPDFKQRSTDLAARFDFVVLPSRFEGFGLSALEAMLAGRPVIVSEIAGLAPHVRVCEGGIVVDAKVESIRAGIEEMIRRRHEWREIGMRGRQYVLENLQWPRIAARAVREYGTILAT